MAFMPATLRVLAARRLSEREADAKLQPLVFFFKKPPGGDGADHAMVE
jgi:hypothetical protein